MPEVYEEEVIDLREYLRAIYRRKWIILAICLAAVISAAVASEMMTPIYEATTVIMAQNKSSGAGQLSFLEGFGPVGANKNQNLVEILKSRSLAMRAAEKLGRSYSPHSGEFTAFRNSISVQLVTGTDAIRIKVESPDPVEARDIANAVVDAFIDYNQELNTVEARNAREFIESQLLAVEADLYKAEEELQRYRETEKVIAPSEEGRAILNRLTELEKAKAEAAVSLSQINHQLEELHNRLAAETPTTITSTTISSNPLVSHYRLRLADLETQLSLAEQQYSADHPKVILLQAEIEQVHAQMAEEVERIISTETMAVNPNYQALLQQVVTLEVEAIALEARQKALEGQIAQVDLSLSSLPEKEVRLTRLVRNQSVMEQLYLLLKNKYEEYRITESVKAAGVSIVDRAVTPQNPVKPRKKLNVAIAGFLGIFISVGLVFLLEFFDTTLKTAEDVERCLGLPILGRIPKVEDEKKMKYRRHKQTA